MAFFMKDDVNNEVPDGTPKTLIPFDGVVNWDGVLKSIIKPNGDHVTHLWGWIEIHVAWGLVWKCQYANDKIEKGLVMWVSSVTDGKKTRKEMIGYRTQSPKMG